MNSTVYLADTAVLEAPDLFAARYAVVPPERRAKIDRLLRPQDQRLSLGAGVLLQKAFDASFPGRAFPRIAYEKNGKPFFPDYPQFCFNLSHSQTKVLCAVSDRPVGCDTELPAPGMEKIAMHFFSEKEQELLRSGPSDLLFCRLWTLKESYLKAIGTGLTRSLASFSVRVDKTPVCVEDTENASRYAFFEWVTADSFCCACCIDEPAQTPELVLTEL